MNIGTQHVFERLAQEYSKLHSDASKYRWLSVATSLMVPDDVCSSSMMVPFVEQHSGNVLEMVFALVEDQTELCILALRFLATSLVVTCRLDNSKLHEALCCQAGTCIPVLVALGKTDDPSLTPLLLVVLSSLACGSHAEMFATVLAIHGDSDAMRLIFKFLSRADRRSTAMDLLAGLMTVKDGIRLCQRCSSAVSDAVVGTQLEYTWKLVHRL